MKQILLKNSIVASNKGNVLCFETESVGSLFSLKWTKRRTPVSEMNQQELTSTDDEDIQYLMVDISEISENILYYISGFLARGLIKNKQKNKGSPVLLKQKTK